jgi:hypothetical protein
MHGGCQRDRSARVIKARPVGRVSAAWQPFGGCRTRRHGMWATPSRLRPWGVLAILWCQRAERGRVGAHGSAHLARRRRPPPVDPCLLDLRPRNGADALPGRRPTPSRLDAAAERCRSPIGAAARRSTCRCPWATGGGPSCRSGTPRRRQIRSVGGNRLSRTGHAIRDPSSAAAIRAARAPVTMPLERLPDLPRVVVARIEGQDTLYEFDLTAAPSPAWSAVFLRPPPALRIADHTPDIGRVCDSRAHGAFPHRAPAPRRMAAPD